MYEAYWQLETKPFGPTDARAYYPSEVHQGALLKLRYAVENRLGAAVLAGASGLGKTLLVHALRRQLPPAAAPFVHLVFPQMNQRELLAYLAGELRGEPAAAGAGVDQTIRQIAAFLEANTARQRHAVVVVDEAHLLADGELLETLRLLLNFEADGAPQLTLLLVGEPLLLPTLDRAAALEERVGVKCLLRAFTLEETMSYVSHRMTAAGARRDVFTSDALHTLHSLTLGNPRRINRLCDLALLIGFAEERREIVPDLLEAVSSELVAVVPE